MKEQHENPVFYKYYYDDFLLRFSLTESGRKADKENESLEEPTKIVLQVFKLPKELWAIVRLKEDI